MIVAEKKILIVTRNLPPLIGGMERLNWHIADELSNDHQVMLISHTNARETAPLKTTFYSVPLNPLPFFLILAFFKTLWVCLIKRPDILFAGSGLTAPIVVFWAKIFRKKSIVYIHGLDIQNESTLYKIVWIPFIKFANQIICNSTPTKELCIGKNLKKDKISIIHPGVTYPPPLPQIETIEKIIDSYQLNNKEILLSVGRLTDRKGLLEFVKLSLPQIVQNKPYTLLVVVGDTAKNALNNKFQSKDHILSVAEELNISRNILFTGAINEDDLSSFFYLANIHIFPVKHIPNDPEGFGMVAIEAAAHGKQTIAFATGGVLDAIKENESGHLIEAENYTKLSIKIIEQLSSNSQISKESCQNFAKNFSWENMRKKLNQLM